MQDCPNEPGPATRGSQTCTRRRMLAAFGAGTVVGFAGCLGGEDLEEETYDDWFRGANNFEGTVDRTGESEVLVEVGAVDGLAYEPAAVRVSTGTTVIWEWTGLGGRHDVVEMGEEFESNLYLDAGRHFSHTFDEPGVYRYVCTPHQTNGMIGAVHAVE